MRLMQEKTLKWVSNALNVRKGSEIGFKVLNEQGGSEMRFNAVNIREGAMK